MKIVAWIILHALIIALGLSVPWHVSSDLYSVLPNSANNYNEAENVLNARSLRNVTILFAHESLDVAINAATLFNKKFSNDSLLTNVKFFVNNSDIDSLKNFFFENRYVLQNSTIRNLLINNDTVSLNRLALEKIYGAFSLADLSRLKEDPLLLGSENFENFVKNSPFLQSRFSPNSGVLVACDSNIFYVMWNASLNQNASVFAGGVIDSLNSTINLLKNSVKNLQIYKSGVPFHSYESSKNAKKEIALISSISFTIIFLILLFVFRSALPLLSILFAVSVAIIFALMSTLFIFGTIHIFTLIFGTSVIGVSVDYAVHFFMNLKYSYKNINTTVAHKKFVKGICLGFLTTELSYCALMFVGFDLMRQVAVFSIAGLLSSFATVLLLFSNIFKPKKQIEIFKSIKVLHFISLRFKVILYFILSAFIIIGLFKLDIKTDISSLYAMSDDLKKSEMLNAKLNDLGVSANYFIIEGNNIEEVLEREQILTSQLDSLILKSELNSYLATSSLILPISEQRKIFYSAKNILKFNSEPNFLTPNSKLPNTLNSMLDMIWIGKVHDKFYSAIFPLHVSKSFDVDNVAKKLEYVYSVNKIANVNNALTKISKRSLLVVAIAYAIVLIILTFVYKNLSAFKIICAPVVSCLTIASVFGYMNMPFNFFAIVGVVLTLGIGIDYALFFKESGSNNSVVTLAVTTSAITTLVSFGGLVFSNFVPVYTLGLAVLIGISVCFFIAAIQKS